MSVGYYGFCARTLLIPESREREGSAGGGGRRARDCRGCLVDRRLLAVDPTGLWILGTGLDPTNAESALLVGAERNRAPAWSKAPRARSTEALRPRNRRRDVNRGARVGADRWRPCRRRWCADRVSSRGGARVDRRLLRRLPVVFGV